MTSGSFHTIPLDQITVDREGRQRRDLTDIDVLAESINRLGLIHPIVVTRDLELVAGERRYTACKSLGWITIPVQYVDELEPTKLRSIELEENIKRQDISWQDQVRAVQEYHRLRSAETPDWNQADTGKAIGLAQHYVGKILLVAEEMDRGTQLIADAPKLSTARGIAERARERRSQQTLEKLHSTFEGVTVTSKEPETILNEDFTKWIAVDPGVKFNFLHCDFPYGIDAGEFPQSAATAHGAYADTPDTWRQLIAALGTATRNHVSSSAHLMFWFAMRKGDTRLYEPTIRALEAFGWHINPIPLIWMKADGSGIIPDPQRGPRQTYETCLFGSKGDRKIVRAVANAYHAPPDREHHMSTKPEPMLRHFFRMLVDGNTVMLDPTCGSGTALRAAESLGARYALGLEINTEFAETARRSLKSARVLRAATELVE